MRFIDKTKELWNLEKGNAKRNLLKLILAVPFWLIVIALFLMAFGISRAVYLTDTRPDQQIAEAWQSNSDTSFRHMAVFAGGIRAQGDTSPMTYQEGGKSIHLADITLMRQALQSTADTGSAAGNKNIQYTEGKQLRGWEDCYSSTVMSTVEALDVVDGLEVKSGKSDAQLVAVGGNYKAFHPFRYLSGGFLPETPVDTNQIVLNDVLAWKFYHSYDVVGNRVMINEQMFTIIGVVEERTTKVAELAGEQEPRAFIYFGALGSICSTTDNTSDDGEGTFSAPADFAIQCYEALLPELVKGVGVTDFKNALPNYSLSNPQLYVSNNTGRFGVTRVFDTVFPLGETDKERLGYEFPYWERAAQLTEDRLFYDYTITGLGIILLLIGFSMIGLKFRAKMAVKPGELEVPDTEDAADKEEKELMLKE
jgi:hypothetical protein